MPDGSSSIGEGNPAIIAIDGYGRRERAAGAQRNIVASPSAKRSGSALARPQSGTEGGEGKAGGDDGRIRLILPAAVGGAVDLNGQARVLYQ